MEAPTFLCLVLSTIFLLSRNISECLQPAVPKFTELRRKNKGSLKPWGLYFEVTT